MSNFDFLYSFFKEALESFARVILPDIYKFYEAEKNLSAYEEWLKTEEGQKVLNETE